MIFNVKKDIVLCFCIKVSLYLEDRFLYLTVNIKWNVVIGSLFRG